jgi:hypothetical protein
MIPMIPAAAVGIAQAEELGAPIEELARREEAAELAEAATDEAATEAEAISLDK